MQQIRIHLNHSKFKSVSLRSIIDQCSLGTQMRKLDFMIPASFYFFTLEVKTMQNNVTQPNNVNVTPQILCPALIEVYRNRTISQRVELIIDNLRYGEENDKAAKKSLYKALALCYYLSLRLDKRKNKDELERLCSEKGHTFPKSTSLITKVVVLVFGIDNNRTRKYARAIRVAAQNNIKSGDLASYFDGLGGIDEVVSTKKNKGLTRLQKDAQQLNDTNVNAVKPLLDSASTHQSNGG